MCGKKSLTYLRLGFAALICTVGMPAFAISASDININGFMATGVSWHDYPGVIANSSITDRPSSYKLTNFGLNFSGRLSDQLEFNATTVIRQREVDPAMVLDAVNVSYQINEWLKVRAGKMRTPIWNIADYVDVSYLHPWARVPEEFYEAPFDLFSFDGLSFSTTPVLLGGNYFDAEVFGGNGRIRVREQRIEIDGDMEGFVGLALRYFGKDWQLRGAWSRTDVRNHTYWDTQTYLSTTPEVVDKTPESLTPTPLNHSNMQFMSLSFQYDDRNYLLWSEVGRLTTGDTDSLYSPTWDATPGLPERWGKLTYEEVNAYYITLGKYFGDRKYLTHFTHSYVDDKNYLGITQGAHQTFTLGLNRYIGDNMVIKLAYGQTGPKDYKKGDDGLFNDSMNGRINRMVNIFDIAFNVIF